MKSDNPCRFSSFDGYSHYSCNCGNQCMGKDYRCNRFERPEGRKLVHLKVTTKSGKEYFGNKEELTKEEIEKVERFTSDFIKKDNAEITLQLKDGFICFRTDAIESEQVIIGD